MLKKYVLEINDLEQRLIERFWPGKLTILFKKNELISDLITSGSDLVGIRFPDNKELVDVIKKLDKPLISTSCNISTRDVITNVSLIEKELLDKISYVYDCGEMSDVSSTIVQVVDNKINILREGELVSLIKEEFRGELL
jgi:L-threonylcarbamoyladenylate synthase